MVCMQSNMRPVPRDRNFYGRTAGVFRGTLATQRRARTDEDHGKQGAVQGSRRFRDS